MLGRYLDTGRPVNRAHSLCAGLTGWFNAGVDNYRPPNDPNSGVTNLYWRDLTGRFFASPYSRAAAFATDTAATGKPGLPGSSRHSTGNYWEQSFVLQASHLSLFPNLSAGTILLVNRHLDTTNRQTSVCNGGSPDGAHNVQLHLPYSDGNAYLKWGNGATSDLLTVAITKDTNWHWWAATVGGGFGMRLYRDGVLLGSNANTPTRGGNAEAMHLNTNNSYTTCDLQEIAEFASFSRALSPSEVWQWMEQSRRGHPDTLNWQNPRAYLFFGSQGAGGGGGGANRRRRVIMTAR